MMWMLFGMGSKDKMLECEESAVYSASTVGFTDATEEWGSQDVNSTGTRISAVDFDEDGTFPLGLESSVVRDDPVTETLRADFTDVGRIPNIVVWINQANAQQYCLPLGDALIKQSHAFTTNQLMNSVQGGELYAA